MRETLLGTVLLLGLMCEAGLGQAAPEPDAASDAELESGENLQAPDDEKLASEIATLILQLGSPHFAEREAATSHLIQIGPPAFAQLRIAYHGTEQLEARLRMEKIVYEAYINYHVYDRNAFLGIRQGRVPITHDDDARILEGHVGIQVVQVIEGTAAERVELEAEDVIIALDQEPISAVDVQVTQAFGELIRVRGPGAPVVLTVLRESDQFDVVVTLGSRPKMYYGRGQGLVYEMLERSLRQFRVFWDQRFRNLPSEQAAEE
ncbi:MAG: PDZ domain-containing protein [Phycisphaerales bacterium]|nr:MAG: PDZ domain-containing protein [Phycisphaerales bacterium]